LSEHATTYLPLGVGQVALAVALILVNGALSFALGLGLERRLLVAGARAVAQLWLMGLILKWVFALEQPAVVLALAGVMTLVASIAAVRRGQHTFPGAWLAGVVSVWASSWLVAGFALGAIVRAEPWYQPQYALPLLGMILGNALNGISLGMDRLTGELLEHRDEVETLLALGATRWEAARDAVRQALRTATLPMINSLLVAGVVAIPGMMTGQLLGGVDPLQATRYQIMIYFLIAAATGLGSGLAALLCYRRVFSARHQFLSDRIERRE
jgi:putative ABC transport system permease protein